MPKARAEEGTDLSWLRASIQPLQCSDVPGSRFGKRQNLSIHLAGQVWLRGLIKSLQEGEHWEWSQPHPEEGWHPVPKALPDRFVPSRRL